MRRVVAYACSLVEQPAAAKRALLAFNFSASRFLALKSTFGAMAAVLLSGGELGVRPPGGWPTWGHLLL